MGIINIFGLVAKHPRAPRANALLILKYDFGPFDRLRDRFLGLGTVLKFVWGEFQDGFPHFRTVVEPAEAAAEGR